MTTLNPFDGVQDLLKDGAVVFEDDKREDFHEAILKYGDQDSQIEKLVSGVSNMTQNPTASLKEQERRVYFEEQAQNRPTQALKGFGLDPKADLLYINTPRVPPNDEQQAYNQIRLIQQSNASRAALLNRYNTRYK